MDAEYPSLHVERFADLAAVLDVNRSWLYDIRRRDNRFPRRGPSGWSVFAVRLLLGVRAIEREKDADYDAFLRACGLTPKPGARSDAIAFLLDCIIKTGDGMTA